MRHENGEVRERSEVRGDVWDGRSEGWHANGQKAFEGRYRQGERAPGWRAWTEDGTPIAAEGS